MQEIKAGTVVVVCDGEYKHALYVDGVRFDCDGGLSVKDIADTLEGHAFYLEYRVIPFVVWATDGRTAWPDNYYDLDKLLAATK